MSLVQKIPLEELYGHSFWTHPPTKSIETLTDQNQNSTEVLNKLNHFYEDLSDLESEYSKKLQNIIRKNGISHIEDMNKNGALNLEGVADEIVKLSEVHKDFSSHIKEKLYFPGKELYNERKERSRKLEHSLRSAWQELEHLKAKCERKSSKYRELWTKMNGLKTKMMTLDTVESQLMNDKLKKMKVEMIELRSQSWENTKEYNAKLDRWNDLWWNSALEFQDLENAKFKHLKTNLWEFANEVSTTCVDIDQIAERIRLNLQSSSVTTDIKDFVNKNQTGKEMIPKLVFTDFAKGEKPPNYEHSVKFQVSEIPSLKHAMDLEKSERQQRRVPPPIISEVQDAEFEYIGKSKETFKELQEQAQLEVAQNRLRVNTVNSKTDSNPSTYNKLMSEYSSNHTEDTSLLSDHYQPAQNDLSFEANDEEDFKNTGGSKKILSGLKDEAKFRSSMFTTSVFNKDSEDNLAKFDQIIKKNNSQSSARKVSSSTLLRKSKSQTTFTNLAPESLPSHSTEGFPVISYAKAHYSYEASIPEELSFKKREILLILHKQPDGWWFAENYNTGDSGLAPSNYLMEL